MAKERKNPILRAASSVRRAISRVTHREKHDLEPTSARPAEAAPERHARPRRTEPDIPLDRLNHAYTPTQTSLKTSFRFNGADQQRDQESVMDSRWNDEDHYTNKSGDPRIGTRGRTYERGERRERE